MIDENNTAGGEGNAFGAGANTEKGGALTPAEDFYASGDTRIPCKFDHVWRRNMELASGKKKKRRHNKKNV